MMSDLPAAALGSYKKALIMGQLKRHDQRVDQADLLGQVATLLGVGLPLPVDRVSHEARIGRRRHHPVRQQAIEQIAPMPINIQARSIATTRQQQGTDDHNARDQAPGVGPAGTEVHGRQYRNTGHENDANTLKTRCDNGAESNIHL